MGRPATLRASGRCGAGARGASQRLGQFSFRSSDPSEGRHQSVSRAMPLSYQLTASLSTGHRMGVLRCGDVMRSANHCSRLSSASPQRSPSAACGTVTRPGHFGSFRTRCCLLRSRKRSLTDFSARPQPEVGTPAAKRTVNGALDPKRKPEWPQEPSSMLAERLAASHRLGCEPSLSPGTVCRCTVDLFEDGIDIEARRLLARRELLERRQPLGNDGLQPTRKRVPG